MCLENQICMFFFSYLFFSSTNYLFTGIVDYDERPPHGTGIEGWDG
jgi:hypothetical protein